MKERRFEGITKKIGAKPFIILIMVLIFLIPVSFIKSLVRDRSYYYKDAVSTILQPKGGEPHLEGLLLAIPYTSKTETTDNQGKTSIEEKTNYIITVPESYNLQTTVKPEYLSRGIFEVPVFNCSVLVQGDFTPIEYVHYNIDEKTIDWQNAMLLLGVSNKKSFTQTPLVQVDNKNLTMSLLSPSNSSPFTNTIFYDLPKNFLKDGFSYTINIELQGGKALHITPLATNNSFSVSSSWATPGFTGGWLPEERNISDNGFSALWNIAGLSTNIPKTWLSTKSMSFQNYEKVNIAFFTPVDNYQKTERSVKYALLFLIIPFFAIFVFEVFTKIHIHPVQYCLIGLENVIFYLLILSISEHFSFVLTYWIASISVSLVMFLYAAAIFKKIRWGGFFALVQIISYTFLFGTLQSEDYALLIGSLGLFFVVALLMLLTRKVDWYGTFIEE